MSRDPLAPAASQSIAPAASGHGDQIPRAPRKGWRGRWPALQKVAVARLCLVAVHAGASAGCAGAQLEAATREDSEAAYRRYLAEHPDGDRSEMARERLEAVAFRRAREGDDIASYNRFLAEFPEGDFADEARERRAWARLRRALAAGGAEPLRRLLRTDAGSEAARRARDRLEHIEAAAAARADEPETLRAYLLAFPEGRDRAAILRRLDDIEFERARGAGEIGALRAYLDARPSGVHAAEAEELVEAALAAEAIASGRREPLEGFLREHPGSPATADVETALAEQLVDRARVTLSPDLARRASELDPGGPAGEAARALLERFRRGGRRLEAIRQHVLALTGPLPVRSVAELREELESADPADGWNAVREAALSPDAEAIDLAVEAAGRGSPMLHRYARAALASTALTGAPSRRRRLDDWAERLAARSANPEDLLRLAAVREALGDDEAALRAYRRAAELRTAALAGSVHWALLAARVASDGERRLAASRVAEVARARLEELLALVPDELDGDTMGQGVLLLRGLQELESVLSAVHERLAAGASGPGDEGEPAGARGELDRLVRAARASARRLEARMRAEDPDSLRDAPAALEALARRHVERRVEAARALGRARRAESVPALAEAARADSREVRLEALRALSAIRDAEARAALLELSAGDGIDPSEVAPLLRRAARSAPAGERERLGAAAAELEARAVGE